MKVNNISGIQFEANKKRFLAKETKANIQTILAKMNQKTTYEENSANTGWVSNILVSLGLNKNIKLIDKRCYVKPVENPHEFNTDCSLYMGKTMLDINSKTGEIVNYKKPFFKTWGKIYKNIDNYIKAFLTDFDNKEKVIQNRLKIAGFTQKGVDLLRNAQGIVK